MANIHHTIEEVRKLNPDLAHQIETYVKDHAYGLVFEENLPEAVRLWKKEVSIGDTVNILPPRGQFDTPENKVPWRVIRLNPETHIATIEHDGESKTISTYDLVTIVSYKDVIYPGLKEIDRVERGEPDDPYHMVINAENYHALQALIYAYQGKVDCIYIDPPYNTGNKDWKYNNDYVDKEDQYRHSKWLAFMKKRLKLAKKLLNPSKSAMIVTIDDKEYLHLGCLLEKLFPDAKMTMISSVINPAGKAKKGGVDFSRTDEYIFFLQFGDCPVLQETRDISNTPIAWETFRRHSLANARGKHGVGACGPNQFYPIYINNDSHKIIEIGEAIPENVSRFSVKDIPGCSTVFPVRDNGIEMNWGAPPEYAKKLLSEGYLRVGSFSKDSPQPYSIQYLTKGTINAIKNGEVIITEKREDGTVNGYFPVGKPKVPTTNWYKPSHNATSHGTDIITKILCESRFDYPKSVYAVRDCINVFFADKKDALIVDFFAGSGTTIQAVNLLNAEDNGKRLCIAVTNNEVSFLEQNKLSKKGLLPSDKEWEELGIARYVTWPRVKCAIEGVDINGKPLTGNYGCEIDDYKEIECDVIDPETENKVRGKVYKKVKSPAYPELANLKMSDGFKANAIFCELTYESEWPVRLDRAFEAIAPILWMQAGCKGKIISNRVKTYSLTDYYGVLFDYYQASKFCDEIRSRPNLKHVFVVTDDQRRYSNICRRLPGIEVHRLYETFLKTFQICGEGGLD